MKKLLLLFSLVCFGQLNAQCTVTITGNTNICVGSCTTLTAGGATSYQWMPSGATTSTISICPTNNTTYTVDGYGSGGCISTQTISVSVNPNPTATFTYALSSCCNQGFFTDNSSITSGNITVWNWTFHSGYPSSATNQNPGPIYLNYGLDTVCLTVTSSQGCKDSTCMLVNETIMSIEKLSNSLSITIYPNPTSDLFFINANTTDKLTVDLFDVNGKHVFSTSVSDKENINVTPLDNGAYTLTIKTTDRVINKKLVILR
ncbi:MAG TPA: T9SS type A sorting domain-containing protein [Bacteroidia bacterium]|jgi:PKD repeat protein|nr:T9SS type A sorting domain-containing protein [Bacteroidia bacterium]